MMRKEILMYFFSGTGNTLWALKIFSGELKKYSIAVKLIPLPCPSPAAISGAAALGIAFPVYAQSAPPFVWDWIKKLPENHTGTPVILVSTLAGFSGLVKGPFYHLLKGKGYLPYAVKEVIMPSNYILLSSNEVKNTRIMEKARVQIANFAKEIAEGKTKWPWRPAFLNFLQFFTEKIFLRCSGRLGKNFFSDREKCSGCGQCVKLCPVLNIEFGDDSRPLWGKKCQQCLRCITFCPAGAVDNKRLKFLYCKKYKCAGINSSDFILRE